MLRGGRESDNIEDRRGMSGGQIALGGGGCGVLVLLLFAFLCGGDPGRILQQFQTQQEQQQTQQQPAQTNPQEEEQRKFVSEVLASTEDVWRKTLPAQARMQYRDPKLVLFDGQTPSACGYASSAVGPFYCPGDEKLYVDFAFFRELKREFKAPGDFAQGYVIAHEVGHHVQNQLGTMEKVQRLQQQSNEATSNRLSVLLELQADCYAGVWGHNMQKAGRLEKGDIEEAITAAAAVGDDMIQKRTQGYVVPESFTHGSAKERATWFARGFQSGDMRQCNTFGR